MLFDAVKDAEPEDLQTVHSMLMALKRKGRINKIILYIFFLSSFHDLPVFKPGAVKSINSKKLKRRTITLKIIFSKEAKKFLKKQDKPTQQRLINAISNIPNGDIKKLQGRDGYRLRVGSYRIIFNEDGIIINIISIGNRGQIYKH